MRKNKLAIAVIVICLVLMLPQIATAAVDCNPVLDPVTGSSSPPSGCPSDPSVDPYDPSNIDNLLENYGTPDDIEPSRVIEVWGDVDQPIRNRLYRNRLTDYGTQFEEEQSGRGIPITVGPAGGSFDSGTNTLTTTAGTQIQLTGFANQNLNIDATGEPVTVTNAEGRSASFPAGEPPTTVDFQIATNQLRLQGGLDTETPTGTVTSTGMQGTFDPFNQNIVFNQAGQIDISRIENGGVQNIRLTNTQNGNFNAQTGAITAQNVQILNIETERPGRRAGTINLINAQNLDFSGGLITASHADSVTIDRSVNTDVNDVAIRYETENINPVFSFGNADQLSVTGGNNEVFRNLGHSTIIMNGSDIQFAHLTSSINNNLFEFVNTVPDSGEYLRYLVDKDEVIDIFFVRFGNRDAWYTRTDFGVNLTISDGYGVPEIDYVPILGDGTLILLENGIDTSLLATLAQEIPINYLSAVNGGGIEEAPPAFTWTPTNLIDLDRTDNADGSFQSASYKSTLAVTDVYFPQEFIFFLQGEKTLTQTVLYNRGTDNDVKDFEIYITTDSDYKTAEWTKVLASTLQRTPGKQTHDISGAATYVRLKLLSSYSDTIAELQEIEVFDQAAENVVKNGLLIQYTTQQQPAVNLVDGDKSKGWSSDAFQDLADTGVVRDVDFPQEITFRFANSETRIINRIVIDNIDAKSFNLFATRDKNIRDATFRKIRTGKLEQNARNDFIISDVLARYLKLQITSGYNEPRVKIGEIEAYGTVPYSGTTRLGHGTVTELLSRGDLSFSQILNEHISWKNQNLQNIPGQVRAEHPIYIAAKGILTYENENITEVIISNNTIPLNLDLSSGIECGQVFPPGEYFYFSKLDPKRDFAALIPEIGNVFQLCLRKKPQKIFDEECNSCGVVDFILNKMQLNGIIFLLKYHIKEDNLASLLLKHLYTGLDIPKTTLRLDDDFVKIQKVTQEVTFNDVTESLTRPSNYISLKEESIDGEIHRLVKINHTLTSITDSTISTYSSNSFDDINIEDNVATGGILTILPPGHADIGEMI